MKVAVVKETAPGERRVALVPETVPRLVQAGLEVLVEAGAGDAAWFPDNAYTAAGATIASTGDLYAAADVILTVTRPDEAALGRLRAGQAVDRHALAADRPAAGPRSWPSGGSPRSRSTGCRARCPAPRAWTR